jgi:hypothetical protein
MFPLFYLIVNFARNLGIIRSSLTNEESIFDLHAVELYALIISMLKFDELLLSSSKNDVNVVDNVKTCYEFLMQFSSSNVAVVVDIEWLSQNLIKFFTKVVRLKGLKEPFKMVLLWILMRKQLIVLVKNVNLHCMHCIILALMTLC